MGEATLGLAPTNTVVVAVGSELDELAGLGHQLVGIGVGRLFADGIQLLGIVRKVQIEQGLPVGSPVGRPRSSLRDFQFVVLLAVGIHQPQRVVALAIHDLRAHRPGDGIRHGEGRFHHGARRPRHERHHAKARSLALPLGEGDVRAVGPYAHSRTPLPPFRNLVQFPLVQEARLVT